MRVITASCQRCGRASRRCRRPWLVLLAGAAMPTSCGSPADLSDAQCALVGRVLEIAHEVHPWTTDPENPDRPDV